MSGALQAVYQNQRSFKTVPGAPTIGTATATGSTTATVSYTAPANNGGATITSYTATSSPGGITGTLSQAGSGTITVTGLSGGTSYTFTVKATNSVGQSAASSASNSITTVPVIGQAYGGGFFAGQISTSGNGVATHNLIVAPKSTGSSDKKTANANYTTPGADSLFNGAQNTADFIADGDATKYPAAHFCNDLVTGGYSDWYMPSVLEQDIIFYNLRPVSYPTVSNDTDFGINNYSVPQRTSNNTASSPGQTSASSFVDGQSEAYVYTAYITSTEPTSPTGRIYVFDMGRGSQIVEIKNYVYSVRAVRKVAV